MKDEFNRIDTDEQVVDILSDLKYRLRTGGTYNSQLKTAFDEMLTAFIQDHGLDWDPHSFARLPSKGKGIRHLGDRVIGERPYQLEPVPEVDKDGEYIRKGEGGSEDEIEIPATTHDPEEIRRPFGINPMGCLLAFIVPILLVRGCCG